ncbi:ribonuclease H-like domain-containing protein [Tanacetum coccineum]
MIAPSSSRYSSNDMVCNHYLEEAKKKTQENGRNSRPSVMPSARSQSTVNGSKPKPKINNQKSRNWPASKSRKIFKSSTTKVDSEPPHGSNTDITNIYECIQNLDSSAGTSINVQEEQTLDLNACTPFNLKKERIKWYDYGYLEEIEVRREDHKLYKFKEGDFPRLNLRDIEDMFLLLVQKKALQFGKNELFDLNVALRMFTRRVVILKQVKDLQLGVESYQKKLNITRPETFRSDITKITPYTTYNNPQGIIYQDKFKRNSMMRLDELYKFCDDTLLFVRRVFHDIASSLEIDYLPKRIWSKLDRKRSRVMIKAIDVSLCRVWEKVDTPYRAMWDTTYWGFLGSWFLFVCCCFNLIAMSVHNFVHNTPHNSVHITPHNSDDKEPNNVVTIISKLDLSHPLHLHPNDSTTLTIVSIKLKGTENYNVWSYAMLLALEGRNKTRFIDNTCRRLYTYEVLGRQWDRVNAMVIGWILNSILEELFLCQIFSKKTYEVWDVLKTTFDRVDGSVTFNLHQKINLLTQNGSSVAEYFNKLSTLWKQFDVLIKIPRDHLPDAKGAYALISSEESHRAVVTGLEVGPSQRAQSFVFNSSVNNRSGVQRSQTSGNTLRPNNFSRPNNNRNRIGDPTMISTLIYLIKENSLNNNEKGVQANMAVPEYSVTIVSVHKVARDSKFIVGFNESKCFLMSQDLMDVKIIEIGKQVNGLYYFDNMKVLPFNIKHNSVDKSSQDLDHVNFFYEIVYEGPDTSYDDNDLNSHDQSDGRDSPNPSSPTIDLFGDDLGHPQGSNRSAIEDEMVATSDPNTALSEDDVPNSLNTEHVQNVNNKPLRRYVVKGYNQKEGIDFDETFSLVVKNVTDSPDDKRVCKLKKSLYELKQAPRQWNAKLTQTLIESGFEQSKSNYSLFTKSENVNFLALLVYVDDIVVTGNNFDESMKFKDFIRTKFQIKDLGKLNEFGLLACKPSATPLEQNLAIANEPTDVDKVLNNIIEYQKLIGKLIYLTHTRPNISYSVHYLSQFMHKPLRSHLKIALKVLRYLKAILEKEFIVKQTKASLEAFLDADWAKCLATRKSVAGFCVKPNGSLVSWKSKKQNTLAKSSDEAEYRAIASVTSEVT